jgi:hypothetical protein
MPDDDQDVDLDDLIEQITVDAYGDEGYWSFLQALNDDAETPFAATIVGTPVRVRRFDFDGSERRGITATVIGAGEESSISLLDITVKAANAPIAAHIIAAYRRWLGLT